MRILAVSQYYWPEPFTFSDICEELVSRGHQVTVLTSFPNYPEGKIYSGYERGKNSTQHHNGVSIRRVRTVPRGSNAITRTLNYYSFSLGSERIVRTLGKEFDVVLSFQVSPVMQCSPALSYGKRYGTPVLLYCLDIWPECLTVGGIKRGSAVYRYYANVSRNIYSSADIVAIASQQFDGYLRDVLGIQNINTVYLPQYAEDIFNVSVSHRDDFDTTKINLTFAGNVGTAQSVKTLVEAANLLSNDNRFMLHVVGSGSELVRLQQYSKKLGNKNLVFHGRHPLDMMPSFYTSSDAMIATFQNNPILGYTLPRKISSYMAAGRPVLGTVVGEARRIIEEAGCGLCCDSENPEALADIFVRFADMNVEEREEMGRRGKSYYQAHLSRPQFFETLDKTLNTLMKEKANVRN